MQGLRQKQIHCAHLAACGTLCLDIYGLCVIIFGGGEQVRMYSRFLVPKFRFYQVSYLYVEYSCGSKNSGSSIVDLNIRNTPLTTCIFLLLTLKLLDH